MHATDMRIVERPDDISLSVDSSQGSTGILNQAFYHSAGWSIAQYVPESSVRGQRSYAFASCCVGGKSVSSHVLRTLWTGIKRS